MIQKENPAGGPGFKNCGVIQDPQKDHVVDCFDCQDNPAAAQISVYTSDSVLTKRLSLDAKGGLVKGPGGKMNAGTVERVSLSGPRALVELLSRLTMNQALGFGVPRFERVRVVPKAILEKARENSKEPVIARTQDHVDWPDGPGVIMLDFDPPKNGNPPSTREQARSLIASVWPEAASAPMVVCDSATSHIHHGKTGEVVLGQRGLRIYLFIRDAADIPRAGKILFRRLALAGHAWVEISAAGTPLERGPVDGAVWQPERLDFAAGADCVPPLKQTRPEPEAFNPDAPFLDTRTMPDLTEQQMREYHQIMDRLKREAQPEADKVRAQWLERRIERELQSVEPNRRDEAREAIRQRLTRAAQTNTLPQDFILYARNGQTATVAELLQDRDRWHGAEFADPLDPGCYNDWRIAVAILNSAEPQIYSHAHGGRRYFLEAQDGSEFENFGPDSEAKAPDQGKEASAASIWDRPADIGAMLAAKPEPMPWLFAQRVPFGRGGAMAAPGGTGKTTLLKALAVGCITGRLPMDGWEVERTGKVVLVLTEDTHAEFHEDLHRLCYNMTARERELIVQSMVVYPLAGKETRLLTKSPRGVVEKSALYHALVAKVQSIGGVVLVGLDPALGITEGDEMNQADQRALGRAVDDLAVTVNATCILLTHSTKALLNADELGSHSSRGGGALTDALRFEITMRGMTAKEAHDHGIEDLAERKSLVQVAITKGNRIPPEAKVPVWLRYDSGTLVSAGLAEPEKKKANSEGGKLPKCAALAFEALKEAAMKYGQTDANGRFLCVAMDDFRTVHKEYYTRKNPTNGDAAERKSFRDGPTKLVELGWIESDGQAVSFSGPGADVHIDTVSAAIAERRGRNDVTERNFTEQSYARGTETAERNVTPPLYKGGYGYAKFRGDFDQEKESRPHESEISSPGTLSPTGTDGEGWEDI